jgi:hypothetical protein
MGVLGTVFGNPQDKSGATTESRYGEGAIEDEMSFETEQEQAPITQPTTTQVVTPRGLITAQFNPRVVSRTPGPAKPGVTQMVSKQGIPQEALTVPVKESVTKWLVYSGLVVAVVGVGYLVLKKVGQMSQTSPATAAVDDIDADVPDCGCKG